jgi:hypothetical protein
MAAFNGISTDIGSYIARGFFLIIILEKQT